MLKNNFNRNKNKVNKIDQKSKLILCFVYKMLILSISFYIKTNIQKKLVFLCSFVETNFQD